MIYKKVFDAILQEKKTQTAQGSSIKSTASSVNNECEGVCPKCSVPMQLASTPVGDMHWCNSCRVATPIAEV